MHRNCGQIINFAVNLIVNDYESEGTMYSAIVNAHMKYGWIYGNQPAINEPINEVFIGSE